MVRTDFSDRTSPSIRSDQFCLWWQNPTIHRRQSRNKRARQTAKKKGRVERTKRAQGDVTRLHENWQRHFEVNSLRCFLAWCRGVRFVSACGSCLACVCEANSVHAVALIPRPHTPHLRSTLCWWRFGQCSGFNSEASPGVTVGDFQFSCW